jgi:hypothetical protein
MNDLPEDLIKAFKNGRGGIFVGAGLSVESGLPTWKGMLDEMIARARKLSYVDKAMLADCEKATETPAKYLMVASALRQMLGTDFQKYVEERFGDKAIMPNDFHRALHDLPWQFILTTNYDRLIERAYNEKHHGVETLDPISFDDPGKGASSLFRERPFILKVHGDAILDPEAIILSERDYRIVIHQQAGLQSLLQTLFTTFTVLFIGAKLDDPDLLLLLGFVHSAFHGKTPGHFAIVSQEERSQLDADALQRDFNIHIITYERAKRRETILGMLDNLKKSVV